MTEATEERPERTKRSSTESKPVDVKYDEAAATKRRLEEDEQRNKDEEERRKATGR